MHPESYDFAQKLIEKMGYTLEDVKKKRLAKFKEEVDKRGISNLADEIGVGVPTLRDQ